MIQSSALRPAGPFGGLEGGCDRWSSVVNATKDGLVVRDMSIWDLGRGNTKGYSSLSASYRNPYYLEYTGLICRSRQLQRVLHESVFRVPDVITDCVSHWKCFVSNHICSTRRLVSTTFHLQRHSSIMFPIGLGTFHRQRLLDRTIEPS